MKIQQLPFSLPVSIQPHDANRVALCGANYELIALMEAAYTDEQEAIVNLINESGKPRKTNSQTLRALLQEAIDAWPAFDAPDDESPEVSGADLVEWFDGFRRRAKDALDHDADETRIIIVMEGGCFQEVLADGPGVDVAMIDYDCEGSESVADIPQDDGGDVYTAPAHVGFLGRTVMPERVAQLWDVISKVENA